jgi:hypothetical protein
MIVGFLGDVHGSALHACSLLAKWTSVNGRKLDMIVQLGDIGIMPDSAAPEPPYDRYIKWNKSIYDLFYLPRAVGLNAIILNRVREHIGKPILFIRGNHDDQPQYSDLQQTVAGTGIPIDPFDIFRYVPDGTRLNANGLEILCMGSPPDQPFQPTVDLSPDVLVTHAGPFGIGRNRIGEIQGHPDALAYVKSWKPTYHIFGHHHHIIGPISAAGVCFIGVNAVLNVPRDGSQLPSVMEDSLMVLNTDDMTIKFVRDEWMSEIAGNLAYTDLERFMQ